MSNDSDTNAQLQLVSDCLRMQIDELSMLQSIFCAADEFKVDDPSIEADVNAFLDGESITITSYLQYTIRQELSSANGRLDIRIELPHLYPLLELANVSVLTATIGTVASNTLRHDLNDYMRSLDPSEVYVYQVYQWVQDNAANYINNKTKIADSQISSFKPIERIEMERLWIYSHHLKSSTKRQEIISLAKSLDLSGFSRPGKPGIICVEGRKVDVQEFWRTVRQWCWQKIQVRKSEVKAVTGVDAVTSFRRFALPLQEKLFINSDDVISKRIAGDNDIDVSNSEDPKMSMALFMKFLDNHRCAYIKKDLFGFE